MSTYVIDITNDFSRYPAGRYMVHGDATGEGFRTKYLVPALRKYDHVIIKTDGILSSGSSFLEEAFGGLVREENFSASDLKRKLEIQGRKKSLINLIFSHIHYQNKIMDIQE